MEEREQDIPVAEIVRGVVRSWKKTVDTIDLAIPQTTNQDYIDLLIEERSFYSGLIRRYEAALNGTDPSSDHPA